MPAAYRHRHAQARAATVHTRERTSAGPSRREGRASMSALWRGRLQYSTTNTRTTDQALPCNSVRCRNTSSYNNHGRLAKKKKGYSSLIVTKKVQRRTLASGTYPNAPTPIRVTCVLRAPPCPSSRSRRLPAHSPRSRPTCLHGKSLPVASAGSQGIVGRWRASVHEPPFPLRPRDAGSLRALSMPPCGGGPGPAGSRASCFHYKN